MVGGNWGNSSVKTVSCFNALLANNEQVIMIIRIVRLLLDFMILKIDLLLI
jgi:hypothetical protein